jgi:hypothetical protein
MNSSSLSIAGPGSYNLITQGNEGSKFSFGYEERMKGSNQVEPGLLLIYKLK